MATGKVAVASVTCGPGVTQLMTALPAAVRAAPADGGVRRRVADQRKILQPVHRPGAAGDGDRRAIHRRPQRAAHDGLRARGLPRRQVRALPGGVGHSLRPAEGRAHGEPALRDLGDVPAQGRAHAARSRGRGRGRRAARRGQAADHPRRPRRGVVRRARCGGQARRSLRRATLQHAAGARSFPRPSVRARHHRQLLHVAGQGDVRVGRRRARGRHQPLLLRRWRALLGQGRQDPVGRCAARLARWAEGRRHLRAIGCAASASRRSSPASTRSWAPASRRRRRYARKSSRIASRPSRRTRCRSTSRPGCSIRAR